MLAALALVLAALAAPSNAQPTIAAWPEPQEQETPDPCNLIRAWVDPELGVDGPFIGSAGTPIKYFGQVNDIAVPFKTLQYAIDAVEHHLVTAFSAGNTSVQGIVYALPGLYGTGPTGNGEVFPVFMRDRVHVQGQGARGTVIRGTGISSGFVPEPVALPFAPLVTPFSPLGEVLVSFSRSSRLTAQFVVSLPWQGLDETSEMLDGFTFQGGEVQVQFYMDNLAFISQPELRGRISNCLFDMRTDWIAGTGQLAVAVQGPWFGIQMAKRASAGGSTSGPVVIGYADQKVLIANNTFILCEMLANGDVASQARPGAVGVIDVTESGCTVGSSPYDPDYTPRGVGNPMLVNNLFRTTPLFGTPPVPDRFAMLGIDQNDTLVAGFFSPQLPSNAFATQATGSASNNWSNGLFRSVQVNASIVAMSIGVPGPLLDCHNPPTVACPSPIGQGCCPPTAPLAPCAAANPPVAGVALLYDPTTPNPGVDPVFVGEYLASLLQPTAPRYRDWRLLPGSPMIDTGIKPGVDLSTGLPFFQTQSPGWQYIEPACVELRSFDWDHEGYGNPRISGASTDIGFDEFQLFIMAGSWANDSNSHNVPGVLNLTPEAGRPARFMIFPVLAPGSNQVTVNGVFAAQSGTPAPSAWTTPPRTTQVINSALPVGFRTRYISFANTPASGTPTPWPATGGTIPSQVNYAVQWNLTQGFVSFSRLPAALDPETATGYFGCQAVVHGGDPVMGALLWSNLQYEYR